MDIATGCYSQARHLYNKYKVNVAYIICKAPFPQPPEKERIERDSSPSRPDSLLSLGAEAHLHLDNSRDPFSLRCGCRIEYMMHYNAAVGNQIPRYWTVDKNPGPVARKLTWAELFSWQSSSLIMQQHQVPAADGSKLIKRLFFFSAWRFVG